MPLLIRTLGILLLFSLLPVCRPLAAPSPSAPPAAGAELPADAGLDQMLAYAERHNPGLRAARAAWEAARARVPQAASLPDPRFTYGYYFQEVETRVGPQRQRFGLSQTFPWFGKLGLRARMAAEAAEAARQRLEAVRLRVAYRVREAYTEFAYLRRAVAITEASAGLLETWEGVIRTRLRAGTGSHAALIKAQVERERLDDRVRSLRDMLTPAAALLNSALGRPADAPLPAAAEIPDLPPPPPREHLRQRVLSANPELLALAHRAARAEAGVELARKLARPDFTLGVDYVQTDGALATGVPDSGKDPVMGRITVNLPIWFGTYRAAEREAEAGRRAALAERHDAEYRLAADLDRLLFRYDDAERKVRLYGDSLVRKAQESVRATERAFTAGKADFLDLVEAQRTLLEFELALARARADRAVSAAAIEMLAGGPSRPRPERTPGGETGRPATGGPHAPLP
ncbi:TolC family protein [Dissulfurirhabdus thermomarina]|uniref:TolC family protein n=1 Tax=Dissulfurirhabdus thermomarina TaxID=1765737 RepID=A0A6N9TR86_DISTH|nr:TolC family protein [Dissulfurirhabdus thermomarina]NDY42623.1 TolC family protein [Dissulfurirhabdus thermomarina]NMX23062.1 TolC family protein [Dissulfurirhabdus thermomarina]